VVMAWVTVIGPHQPADFRMAELSAVAYFNNWWLIFHDVSYFAHFAPPSPLNHLWSLSVEEQFYIVWPFLLMAALHFVPEARRKSGPRPRLAAVALIGALLSGILMAVLYHPSLDPSRVYYGTDTRALELLVGAALAMVWPSRRLTAKVTPQARRTIDAAGLAGLVVIGLMFWRSSEFSPFIYRGGFALLAIGTAISVGQDPARLHLPRPHRLSLLFGRQRQLLGRDHPRRPRALPHRRQAGRLQRRAQGTPSPLRPHLLPKALCHLLCDHLCALKAQGRHLRQCPHRPAA